MCCFQTIKRLNKPYLTFHVTIQFNIYFDKIFPFVWQEQEWNDLIYITSHPGSVLGKLSLWKENWTHAKRLKVSNSRLTCEALNAVDREAGWVCVTNYQTETEEAHLHPLVTQTGWNTGSYKLLNDFVFPLVKTFITLLLF